MHGVGSQKSALIDFADGEVSGKAVEEHGGFNGAGCLVSRLISVLSKEAGDDACEQIAAAAFGHGGIAGGIHGDMPVGMRDECPSTFEYERYGMFLGEGASDLKTVDLNLGDACAGQT